MITILQTIQDLQLRCLGRGADVRFTIMTYDGGTKFKVTLERYSYIPKTFWFYNSDETLQWGEKLADIEAFLKIEQ